MFRNLTVGQWIMFLILTIFTFFGGFLYVVAEAHFNRADRVLAVTAPLPAPTPTQRKPMPEWAITAIFAMVVFGLAVNVVGHLLGH